MKTISILALLSFLTVQSVSQGIEREQGGSGLRPDVRLIRQAFCRNGEAFFLLDISLQNLKKAPLIVRRKLPPNGSYSVTTVNSSGKGKLISNSRATTVFAEYQGDLGTIDASEFVVLQPGDRLEFRSFPVEMRLYGARHRDDINEGGYVASFDFILFPYWTDPKKFHWAAYGTLWTSTISAPIPFTIEKRVLEELHSDNSEGCRAISEAKPVVCRVSNSSSDCTKYDPSLR
jgi:hypothetical protein